MNCLSLWQPWASLVIIGAKRFETRFWATNYRGPLAVHAAKKWDLTLARLCVSSPFAEALARLVRPGAAARDFLPFGAVIGTVELVDVVRIDTTTTPAGWEREFGDYTPGRYRWELSNPRAFAKPVPYRGAQGLFHVDQTVIESGFAP